MMGPAGSLWCLVWACVPTIWPHRAIRLSGLLLSSGHNSRQNGSPRVSPAGGCGLLLVLVWVLWAPPVGPVAQLAPLSGVLFCLVLLLPSSVLFCPLSVLFDTRHVAGRADIPSLSWRLRPPWRPL